MMFPEQPKNRSGGSARLYPHWSAVVVGVVTLAALGMHAYLGSFSRFMADDYCSAAQEKRFGILRAAWYWYLNWNGRYSANFLDAFFGWLGPGFTPALTALVLIVWLLVLAASLRALSSGAPAAISGLPLTAVGVACCALVITLALAPDVGQALYWGQGMRSIVAPLITGTAFSGICAWVQRQAYSRRRLVPWLVLGFLLGLGAGGFSETYTAFQVTALGLVIVLWAYLRRQAAFRDAGFLFAAAGFLGASLAFGIVVGSPGNAARAAFYPPPPALPRMLSISWHNYLAFFASMVSTALKAMAVLASIALGLWIGSNLELPARTWVIPAAALALSALLVFSCFIPAAYGESQAPPDRTQLIPTFVLVIGLVGSSAALGTLLQPCWKGLKSVSSGVAAPLLLALAALSITQLISQVPTHAAYARAWARFHGELTTAHAAGVPSMQIDTSDLHANNWAALNELGDNPKFWLNKCVSDYYAVSVISTNP